MTEEDPKIISESFKSKGNQCYNKGDYEGSIRHYSQAIKVDPSNSVFYCNRALANIKLNRFFNAEKDCTKALNLNQLSDKALYRRGLALKELKRFRSALDDFEKASRLSPQSDDIKREINSIKMLMNKNEKIRINSMNIEKEFQSKTPLKSIPIQCNNINIVEESIDSDLTDLIKGLATHNSPKSYGQFEYLWRQLTQCSLAAKLKYIEKIDIADFKTIFAFPLDPQILYQVLETLSHSKNQYFVWEIIQLLPNMPRFALNICLFGNDETEVLYIIFQNILKSNLIKKCEIVLLAKSYNLAITRLIDSE